MAEPLKTKGIKEIEGIERRIRRQAALQRITRTDEGALLKITGLLAAKIINMKELDNTGQEVSADG